MTARVPIYEGDGLLRKAPAKATRPSRTEAERVERRARELRAELIADLFSRLFRWIERSFWRARQRDLEHYLSQATDAADLERRMRALERLPRSDVLGSFR